MVTIILYCFLLLSVLQHHLNISISVHSYTPVENFAIGCGTSRNSSDLENRTWIADIQSEIFSLIEPQNDQSSDPARASDTLPSAVGEVPYGHARLSRSKFTYSFTVTEGQKFIRLHFYPASYSHFESHKSLFSVRAANFTLLKDFNASLTASAYNLPTVSKEYCINIEPGQRLNLTFTPSPSHPDAYAFINAIEVVSMPTDLYFTEPNKGFPLLGTAFLDFHIDNKSALELAYRIKVGGSQIPPSRDTGMFRYWDDDDAFLKETHPNSLSFNLRKLNYSAIPNYTAPDEVYTTARIYGMNETARYNVTWEFEVDSKFTYMVRLHFCELAPQIQKGGDRVFQIFIADRWAEQEADVFKWTEGVLVPYYKDYAIRFEEGSLEKRLNLSIKLQPLPDPHRTVYDDVILNGIEIFKVSDDGGNLAEPNPEVPPSRPQPSEQLPKSTSNKTSTMVAIVIGAAVGFIVLCVMGFVIFRPRFRAPKKAGDSGQKSTKPRRSSLPSDLCRYFSMAEIRAATNDFDDMCKVGVGGFGNVYKGYIDDSTIPVAIKRLKPDSQQGAHEFRTEIETLSQLRHTHLVSLIGYCNDGNEMILVYEFMARGTVRDHLYDSDTQPLSWTQRLEICLGAARGLHYLHTGAIHNIIHRDVKTTNILIDEKWVAKVSDFGLSKIGPTGMSTSHISTVVKGSMGYVDPEYYKRQRLTLKSDVYSFGVVLLEVLCGRPPLLRTVEKQKVSLVEWVRRCHQGGVIRQTVDPLLIETITPECLKAFCEMALKCLVDDGNERPSMSDVVWGLEFALELQRSTEKKGLGGTLMEERDLLRNLGRHEEESEVAFLSSEGTGSESKSSKMTISGSEEGFGF